MSDRAASILGAAIIAGALLNGGIYRLAPIGNGYYYRINHMTGGVTLLHFRERWSTFKHTDPPRPEARQ
jgi:hypothetical protein